MMMINIPCEPQWVLLNTAPADYKGLRSRCWQNLDYPKTLSHSGVEEEHDRWHNPTVPKPQVTGLADRSRI
jgi:hypothetical protein